MNWIWIKNKFLNISKIFWQILDEGCTPFKPLIDINKSFHFRWRTFKLICMKLEMNKHICIYIYTLRIYYIINIIIYDKKKTSTKITMIFSSIFFLQFWFWCALHLLTNTSNQTWSKNHYHYFKTNHCMVIKLMYMYLLYLRK